VAHTIAGTCIGCTACIRRCPTGAIFGVRGQTHLIDPDLCIGRGCEQCINICPFDALYLDLGDGKTGDFFGVVRLTQRCSGPCRMCEQACVRQKLGLCRAPPHVCTGCGLCVEVCGWQAIYVEPSSESFKKRLYKVAPRTGIRRVEEEEIVPVERRKVA
jgi:electron transport complex protein RnfB